jgi:hypothetical protein
VVGFVVPITAIAAIGALARHGPLPMSLSQNPTPISALLKTKAEVQFDRTVTERSKPFFPVFQGSNRGRFWPCFLV